jgi:hypothetical protein
MDEVFPILAGVALGFIFWRRPKTIITTLLLALIAIGTAVIASTISGELALSWWYVGADLIEVVFAALATTMVASRASAWLSRRERLAGRPAANSIRSK